METVKHSHKSAVYFFCRVHLGANWFLRISVCPSEQAWLLIECSKVSQLLNSLCQMTSKPTFENYNLQNWPGVAADRIERWTCSKVNSQLILICSLTVGMTFDNGWLPVKLSRIKSRGQNAQESSTPSTKFTMTVSPENAASPKSTKSRVSDSSVSCCTDSNWHASHFHLNLFRRIRVGRFDGFRGCSIFSGICKRYDKIIGLTFEDCYLWNWAGVVADRIQR